MIESTSHAALVEWKRRRKEYEQEVAIRCCHDPEQISAMTTDICSSFEPSLLEVLCDLEWGINKEDLTNEVLLGKIDIILATVKNNTVPNVAVEFKAAVRMNLHETDVRERVVQYFRASRQVIDEHGWCKFFMHQEGLKLKCKLLVASLEPQALREEIESILVYQNRTARSDEKVLFKIILEKALELERDFQRRKRQRSSARTGDKLDSSRESSRSKKKYRSKDGDEAKPVSQQPQDNVSRKQGRNVQQGPPKTGAANPIGGCLKCKGDHWLVKCPVATHDEKANLLRQPHERRNREKADRKKVAHD
ncbi:hypothetical protein PPTG_12993 [Phytophthora nicotianae INRA-310]|uniref:Uncharacterized protein n=1 Tax=Phytophthora nicotianae (strain INRA-310) TaxID=761204 RepID=W2Q5X1_PHYN3|nr:hypothetical protein PPTG_12993 [Phytophthora nicotianae INRA-310]ETN07650.1 hypothetical protein PPTG_12993 [Phytophthora nicotianae INRA-310]